MLKTFDGKFTLEVDGIRTITLGKDGDGREEYNVQYRDGKRFWFGSHSVGVPIEKEYPEFTEWFLSLGKE